MDNFLIGHYGIFDRDKQNRDYLDIFWGVEACMIKSEDDIRALHDYRIANNVNLGIHFPLRADTWILRDPQYLSNDGKIKLESYEYMRKEFEYVSQFNPEYILIHYPKPVILDDRVNWLGWGWWFSHDSEYCYMSNIEMNTFKERSEEFFKWFVEQSKIYRFKPVIELDAIPPYVYNSDLFIDLLNKYNEITVFADIGRLHFQNMIDENFDSYKFLESIVPYISGVHLWNVKVTDKVSQSHYPALQDLNIADGWADVEQYFKILNRSSRKLKILFEHKSELISSGELMDCYNWISKLYNV